MRTRAQDDADGGGAARLTLTVNVHISADTTVEVTTYPGQGLATVTFEGPRHATDVTLFLHTPELREQEEPNRQVDRREVRDADRHRPQGPRRSARYSSASPSR